MTDGTEALRAELEQRAHKLKFGSPALKLTAIMLARHIDENFISTISQSELARLVEVTPRTMGDILKRLEVNGSLVRHQLGRGDGLLFTAYIRLTLPEPEPALDAPPRSALDEALLGHAPTGTDQAPSGARSEDKDTSAPADDGSEPDELQNPSEATQRRWMQSYADGYNWNSAWGEDPGYNGCRVSGAIQREFGTVPYEDLSEKQKLERDMPF